MSVRPATLGDLFVCSARARPDEIEQFEALYFRDDYDPEYNAVLLFNSMEKFCIADEDGSALVCFGGDEVVPGIWQPWMVGSMEAWEQHWHSITRIVRRHINWKLARGARRVQLFALQSREKTCMWYERGLKMELNGVLPKYGHRGETVVLYGITNGES